MASGGSVVVVIPRLSDPRHEVVQVQLHDLVVDVYFPRKRCQHLHISAMAKLRIR